MPIRSRFAENRTTSIALAVLSFALLATGTIQPQEHPNVARGFSTRGSSGSGDVDSINPFNGNLTVAIPLGQTFPVNGGLSYGLSLIYNSQVWEYEERDEPPFSYVQALPVQVNNAGLGWLVTLGRFNPPQPTGDLNVARDTYLSPDGSRHTFYPNLHEGEPIDPDFEYTRGSWSYTTAMSPVMDNESASKLESLRIYTRESTEARRSRWSVRSSRGRPRRPGRPDLRCCSSHCRVSNQSGIPCKR